MEIDPFAGRPPFAAASVTGEFSLMWSQISASSK
jgi:hypothetical protein